MTDDFNYSFTFSDAGEVLKAAQKTGLDIYRAYFDEVEDD